MGKETKVVVSSHTMWGPTGWIRKLDSPGCWVVMHGLYGARPGTKRVRKRLLWSPRQELMYGRGWSWCKRLDWGSVLE